MFCVCWQELMSGPAAHKQFQSRLETVSMFATVSKPPGNSLAPTRLSTLHTGAVAGLCSRLYSLALRRI